jgi:hypothetical protein
MAASLNGGGCEEPCRRFERLIHWSGGTCIWASTEREKKWIEKKKKAIRFGNCKVVLKVSHCLHQIT